LIFSAFSLFRVFVIPFFARREKKLMPRFVILEHDHPALHWDFMLEVGPVLRTWRLSAPPTASRMVEAVASFDHRAVYLDYEGEVSGDRGVVRRWDAGQFDWIEDTADCIAVRLAGRQLLGLARLQRSAADKWTLQFEPESRSEGPSL
jgi:hypothetical protein